MKDNRKSLKISPETYNMLKSKGKKGDSYDRIIKKIIGSSKV